MGFCNLSFIHTSSFASVSHTIVTVAEASPIKQSNKKPEDDFFFWLSGFTDAEGNFLIYLDRGFVRFRFKISLHIDDLEVLNTIKSKLNVGKVTVEVSRDRCNFIVDKHADILNVICPLFKSYPLHTSKRLDFEDFNQAVLIKDKTKQVNKSLSSVEMEKIISLKNGMNSNRKTFTYNINKSQIIINPNWFIGFLEGEGTFGIKTGSALYFQVAQKNTSLESLNAISTFLTELPSALLNSKILPLNVVSSINIKTDVISLMISSVDSLYYSVLPYLDTHKMYSRKAVDFQLWKIALLLKIRGYYYLLDGKKLFLDISDTINKRYTTSNQNTDGIISEILERSEAIFATDSPFDVKAMIPHIDNVRKLSRANKSLKPVVVYIYENKHMVEGSPFASYGAAHKSLGLKTTSNTCNRYMDTNRLYKNKYMFTSKPIDSTSKVGS